MRLENKVEVVEGDVRADVEFATKGFAALTKLEYNASPNTVEAQNSFILVLVNYFY